MAYLLSLLGILALAAPSLIWAEPSSQSWAGRSAWTLEGESLCLRSSIWSPDGSRAGLALDATGGKAELAGGFRLLPESQPAGAGAEPWLRRVKLQLGPGRPGGLSSILAAPASLGEGMDPGSGAQFDSTLESRTSILSLDASRFSFFALSRGGKARLARLNCLPAAEEERSDCLGAGFRFGRAGNWWALAAAASRPASESGRRDSALYHGVLQRGLVDPEGSCSAGLAASFSRPDGPALAARIEAERRIGRSRGRLAFGAAGDGFRCLFGDSPARVLGFSGELRVGLGRGASFEGKVSYEGSPAAGKGRLAPPAFSRELRLGLTLPYMEGRLEAGLALDKPAGGRAGAVLSLDFVHEWKRQALRRRISLEAEFPALSAAEAEKARALGESSGLEGPAGPDDIGMTFPLPELRLALCTSRLGSVNRGLQSKSPFMEIEATLLFFEGGIMEAPVQGAFAIGLSLPARFGSAGGLASDPRLELELSLSREWADLVIVASKEGVPEFSLRLSYEAAFGR